MSKSYYIEDVQVTNIWWNIRLMMTDGTINTVVASKDYKNEEMKIKALKAVEGLKTLLEEEEVYTREDWLNKIVKKLVYTNLVTGEKCLNPTKEELEKGFFPTKNLYPCASTNFTSTFCESEPNFYFFD